MRLTRLIFTLFMVLTVQVISQTKVSLDEAVSMALKYNPVLIEQQSFINKAKIEIDDANRYPNPSLNMSWEHLGSDGQTAGEWIVGGSMPLNFLWERKHNITSKELLHRSLLMTVEQTKYEVLARLKKAYLNYDHLNRLAAFYDSTLRLLVGLEVASQSKLEAGDISKYELQRISLEIRKYRNDLMLLEQERDAALLDLKLLTGQQTDTEKWLTEQIPLDSAGISGEAMIEYALKNRFDIKALDLRIESEKKGLEYNESKKFPGIELGAGYKRQYDNFAGPVIQLNVEVPLFGRNRKETELSGEEIRSLTTGRKLLTDQIVTRVKFAAEKYQLMKGNYAGGRISDLEGMLETAMISYTKGELSLVEFLDGVGSYINGSRMNADLALRMLESRIELENAAGFDAHLSNQ